jgi:pyruvate formate lyase activating enzyme
VLIERDWHRIESYRVTAQGRCPDCAAALPGRFEVFDKRGQFGRRRIPLEIGR